VTATGYLRQDLRLDQRLVRPKELSDTFRASRRQSPGVLNAQPLSKHAAELTFLFRPRHFAIAILTSDSHPTRNVPPHDKQDTAHGPLMGVFAVAVLYLVPHSQHGSRFRVYTVLT
jgi:hypothetical protein